MLSWECWIIEKDLEARAEPFLKLDSKTILVCLELEWKKIAHLLSVDLKRLSVYLKELLKYFLSLSNFLRRPYQCHLSKIYGNCVEWMSKIPSILFIDLLDPNLTWMYLSLDLLNSVHHILAVIHLQEHTLELQVLELFDNRCVDRSDIPCSPENPHIGDLIHHVYFIVEKLSVVVEVHREQLPIVE